MISRIIIFLLFGIMFSCGKDLPVFPEKQNFSITDTIVNNTTFRLIKGLIDKDTMLDNSKPYLINSIVFIEDEKSCIIEQGSKFYFTNENLTGIVVNRGAKLLVQGTEQNPVLMTSYNDIFNKAKSGDWCGVHINGQALINKRSEGLSSVIGKYGRLDDSTFQDDDSGKYMYLIIKYAGKSINGQSGSLNINGVGYSTEFKNIQLYKCQNSALRIRGGSARLKNIICSETKGTSVEWDNGWTGYGQNWVNHYFEATSDTITSIEINNDFPDIKPESNPVISNVTIVGLGENGVIRGIRFRESTKGIVVNSIIADAKRGLRVDVARDLMEKGSILFSNNVLSNNSPDYYKSSTSYAEFFNQDKFQNLSENINLNGFIGSKLSNVYNIRQKDIWFDAVDYIGGVKDISNDWTKNWSIK